MDVFALRDQLIDEYRRYVEGFITVRAHDARRFVDDYFTGGKLWPEPLVQLNPSFAPGRSLDELTAEGVLHRDCATIFRRRDEPNSLGKPIRLHQHQEDAIRAAASGQSYVLTTGTGSGKSLAYFIPIVDHVLRAGPRRGVKAIVVYPMNALCNSQSEALLRFLEWGYPNGRGPVRFARYTGQEKPPRRQEIIQDPPDILLTNYVMLELILTRGGNETKLVEAMQGLEFLVLDELHTYRGRQGADVAMLARRVRERCGSPTMRCVGTSATLATSGTRDQRRAEVAAVASQLFGSDVPPENVIGETLRRATQSVSPTASDVVEGATVHVDAALGEPTAAELTAAVSGEPAYDVDFARLAAHPLARWAETAFGLREDEQGRLERREAQTASDVAKALSASIGVDERRCLDHLRRLLLAGSAAADPTTGFPLFAFRLHQFISRGDAVYATPEPEGDRYLTADGQVFKPGDRDRRLFPMAFCRMCGQDYLVVAEQQERQLVPRDLGERSEEDGVRMGFLAVDGPDLLDPDADPSLLPEDWTELRRGGLVVRSHMRRSVPRRMRVAPDGRVVGDAEMGGASAWFVPAPFRFCLGCGVTYATGREKDFTKLAELSSEGRSTATTVLSIAVVRALRQDLALPAEARKLLSFTDNRQDASLQAGHFNDFVQVTLLRAAILAAVEHAGDEGLPYDQVAQRTAEALGLTFLEVASNPEARFAARQATLDALRDVVGYRVYHDLRRGWRVTAPNLEQVGLLRVTYDALDELCAADDVWRDKHAVLAEAKPAERERVCGALLDYMRRSLAIKVTYLDPSFQDALRQRSFSHLKPPWAFDEAEQLRQAAALATDPAHKATAEDATLTRQSLAGRYLRRGETWPSTLLRGGRLPAEELDRLTIDVMRALVEGGHVEEVAGVPGAHRLQAAVMRWRRGDGVVRHDPIRVPNAPTGDTTVHAFFAELYRTAAVGLRGFEAREHTSQVPSDERERREERFGKAELPVLYCSPTMELGVDIRDLNAVNLRNVPPTPANYAQRSGRAGRGGQPALVLTYCTSMSPHDQHYFRRPKRMVSGAVAPPRIDLANEDLLRAHVHAVWLSETAQSLHSSVSQLLTLDEPDLSLKPDVRSYIDDPSFQLTADGRCRRIFETLRRELTPERASWFTEDWLTQTVRQAPLALDRAADRWRHLFRSATEQQARQNLIVADPLRTADEKRTAQRLRDEAEAQIDLLTRAQQDIFSDFYSYRYFATEGFLPGYNFPRLPVTAYIPGRRSKGGEDEFLTRGRFIAISEFGPRSILYHEGSRYRVGRVVLPHEEGDRHTRSAQVCTRCGYVHDGDRLGADVCDRCGVTLTATTSHRFENLLRLESVSTYRVDRISCDEEERMRQGYEIRTVFRFSERNDGSPVTRTAIFSNDDGTVAEATYGPAATLWRINLGWNRRKDKHVYGFNLDMERGAWSKSEQEPDTSEQETDPLATPTRVQRVVPFVEDHRNALVLRIDEQLDTPTLLTLQYALARGIETRYQLEGSELACEPLPSADHPEALLFYEMAEGGAGVLTRLAQEPGALAEVAREALEICHFDPMTGRDKGRPEGADEECEAACYDCLLSYSNQRYHEELDRKRLPDLLLRLAGSTGAVGSGGQRRDEQRDRLLLACESDLERDFIRWLADHHLRLPDRAQPLHDGVPTRPDFAYDDQMTYVYVDGAPHRFPERRQRDAAITTMLEGLGWTVVRVSGPESWPSQVKEHAWVFGG